MKSSLRGLFCALLATLASCGFIEKSDFTDTAVYQTQGTSIVDQEGIKNAAVKLWNSSKIDRVSETELKAFLDLLDVNLQIIFSRVKTPDQNLDSAQIHKLQEIFLPHGKSFSRDEVDVVLILKRVLVGGSSDRATPNEILGFVRRLKTQAPAVADLLEINKVFAEHNTDHLFLEPHIKIIERAPLALRALIEHVWVADQTEDFVLITQDEINHLVEKLAAGAFSGLGIQESMSTARSNVDGGFRILELFRGEEGQRVISSKLLNQLVLMAPSISRLAYYYSLSEYRLNYKQKNGVEVATLTDQQKGNFYRLSHDEESQVLIQLDSVLDLLIHLILPKDASGLGPNQVDELLVRLKGMKVVPADINNASLVKMIFKLKSKTTAAPINKYWITREDLSLLVQALESLLYDHFTLAEHFASNCVDYDRFVTTVMRTRSDGDPLRGWLNRSNRYFEQSLTTPGPSLDGTCKGARLIYFLDLRTELFVAGVLRKISDTFDFGAGAPARVQYAGPDAGEIMGMDERLAGGTGSAIGDTFTKIEQPEMIGLAWNLSQFIINQIPTARAKMGLGRDAPIDPKQPKNSDSDDGAIPEERFKKFEKLFRNLFGYFADHLLANAQTDGSVSISELSEFVSRATHVYSAAERLKQGVALVAQDETLKPAEKESRLQAALFEAALNAGVGPMNRWFGGQNPLEVYSALGQQPKPLRPSWAFTQAVRVVGMDHLVESKTTDLAQVLGVMVLTENIFAKVNSPRSDRATYKALRKFLVTGIVAAMPELSQTSAGVAADLFLLGRNKELLAAQKNSTLTNLELYVSLKFTSAPDDYSPADLMKLVLDLLQSVSQS